MRLNPFNPDENPVEAMMYCFGGDDDGGDSGAGGSAGDFEGTNFGGDTATAGGSLSGGGGDGGRDAFDASGDYVSQAVSSFQSPSVGVMATPMQAATGQAGYSAPSAPSFGGGDNDNDGIPNSIDAMPNTPNFSSPVQSFAPNLINQPLAVGSKVAVMPYESYQRSPQQMFGYGGLTAAPYSPSAISFQGGRTAGTFDPLGGERITQFDMGRSPVPSYQDDRNFLEKTIDSLGRQFNYQNQRAGVFDPRTGTFKQFDGQTTLEKTSDNAVQDFLANLINPFKPFTGFVDTKTYQPLAGGEELQYSDFRGGLLSDFLGENLVPMSEIEARSAQSAMGSDGGGDQPLIIPEEVGQVDEETREPTQFPTFTPREYKYQPFTAKFYSIPSRFTQPMNLLG